jgi:chorismate mutase
MRPDMAVSGNIGTHLTKIDEQLIALIAERVNACQKALEEDENAFDAAAQAELVATWEEAADEKGLNMTVMSHICKLLMKLSQAGEE